jgi:DNA-binding protein
VPKIRVDRVRIHGGETQMANTNTPILPIAPVERIVRKAGAERVSEDAGIELAKVLEEYGIEIAREAISLAKHAKRTTVKEEDIRLASERLKKYGDKPKSANEAGDTTPLLSMTK